MSRRLLSRLSALVVGFAILAPSAAAAEASRLGGSFGIPGVPSPLKRYPDVAYDAVSNVYLAVAGNGVISATFVSADGVPLASPIAMTSAGFAQTPRVAFSPDAGGFLVTWLDTRANPNASAVWGRLVAYNGGAPVFLSPEFQIAPAPGGVHSEMGAAVAYSTGSDEFLVAWMQYGGNTFDVRAQRVGNNGSLLGGEIVITADSAWQAQPAVAYNAAVNEFLVAYGYSPASGGDFIAAARVQSGSGAVLSSGLIVGGGVFLTVPEVRYMSGTGQYMVAWYQGSPSPVFYGRLVNGDGGFPGNIFPIAAGYGSYDGFSFDYNPVSGTNFAVFHDACPPGVVCPENIGVQFSTTGIPDSLIVATGAGGNGNFNPRVAASSQRPEWLLATAHNFSSLVGQRIQSSNQGGPGPGPGPGPEPPPPSATIDLSPGGAPNGSWFFAEGANGNGPLGFDTYYLIANENNVPVDVRAYAARDDGYTTEYTFPIAPFTRRTVRLGDHVGSGAYSAVFQSLTPNRQIYVERAMYWGSLEGSSDSVGTRELSTTWMFAEGSTKSDYFDNFFLLFNPSSSTTARVTGTFFRPGSAQPIVRQYSVPPQARVTVFADVIPVSGNDPSPALANTDFSARFDSTVPIVAERSMYWGPGYAGGTNSYGATAPAPVWYFAEGAAAPSFDTYYTVLNPTGAPVALTATYAIEGRGIVEVPHIVPANSRETFWLAGELGEYALGVAAAFRTANGEGIVVERSIYWGGGSWVEGSNAMGVTAPAPEWHLPEGTTKTGFETYLLLANINAFNVVVQIITSPESGGEHVHQVTLPPLSRTTVYMNDPEVFPALANESFHTRVVAVTDGSIIAEHAVYWNWTSSDYWRGGSSSFGSVK